MPQRNLLILLLSALISLTCYYESHYGRYAAVMADAMGQIMDRYVEPIERRTLFEGAMQGMVAKLDQYSGYITEESLQRLHEVVIDQQFGGVGIEVVLDDGKLTVLNPIVDTPAYDAGMQPGDVIEQIDGKIIDNITLDEAVGMMRGEVGAEIELLVRQLGESQPTRVVLKRAVINVASAVGYSRDEQNRWRFFLDDYRDIAYIRVTTFGDKTADEMERVLRFDEQSVRGIIIDLRGNVGGLLTAAVDTCDLFLTRGQIVTTRDRNGRVDQSFSASSNHVVDKRLPIAVLVNRFTASASEIMAACLQDHGRAKIVGQRTWGKGTVQNVIELEGGRSAIKLTTSTYWRPSLKNIHRTSTATDDDDWGVRPDDGYQVVLTDEQYVELIRARQQRDIDRAKIRFRSGNASGSAPDGIVDRRQSAELGSEKLGDPQLDKAIDFIIKASGTEPTTS